MKKNLSDKEIDRLIESVVCDASHNEDELREIANSPTVWWAVQREIAKGSEAQSPWPPANVLRRWLMILGPATAAAALAISLFVWWPKTSTTEVVATVTEGPTPATQALPAQIESVNSLPPTSATGPSNPIKTTERSASTKPSSLKSRNTSPQIAKNTNKTTEIKTEFIALTYARNPESGQIVRVKVPRSMMVTLGLVASVEKPTNLVDAEVLVGDDGLTRAIRFIH